MGERGWGRGVSLTCAPSSPLPRAAPAAWSSPVQRPGNPWRQWPGAVLRWRTGDGWPWGCYGYGDLAARPELPPASQTVHRSDPADRPAVGDTEHDGSVKEVPGFFGCCFLWLW